MMTANPHPGLIRFTTPGDPCHVREIHTGDLPGTASHLLSAGAVIVGAYHYPLPEEVTAPALTR